MSGSGANDYALDVSFDVGVNSVFLSGFGLWRTIEQKVSLAQAVEHFTEPESEPAAFNTSPPVTCTKKPRSALS